MHLGAKLILLNLPPSSLPVRGQSAVLPEPSQHPDGEVPAQPPRHQQHAGGELQQHRLAEERGAAHLPRPAEGARRLPDLLRREVSQPGARGNYLMSALFQSRLFTSVSEDKL